jgi:hypothetical protein
MKKTAHFYIDPLCNNKYFFPGLYAFIILLYSIVAVQSFGYDDEFFNIYLIETYGFKAISRLQHADIHPPLSYVANAVIFQTFHSWTAVRLISGQALVVFLLLALNPAILMWCTGIRWYAYFLPILLYLVFLPVRSGYKEWVKILAAITLLAYIEYRAFLIILPVLLLRWTFSEDTSKTKFRYLLYLSPPFVALYGYQLFVFLTVHLNNKGMQVSHFLGANLRGYFISQISNQGVFPVSMAALLSIAGSIGILLCIIGQMLRVANTKRTNVALTVYVITVVSLLIAGVAWKPRNLILLIPFQVFLIANYYTLLRNSRVYTGAVILLGIANVCGCVNVAFHENTTKNSWNLPVKETIDEIRKLGNNDSSLMIFTYDPTLHYVLQKNNFNVVSLNKSEKTISEGQVRTAVFIKTFKGTIPKTVYDSLVAEENSIQSSASKVVKISRDKYYQWKRKVVEEYPEYEVELLIYQTPLHLDKLIFWNGKRGYRRTVD